MSWFTYIIYSSLIDKYYTGNTENIKVRLDRHNSGWGQYTKRGIPWKLVYFDGHLTTKLNQQLEFYYFIFNGAFKGISASVPSAFYLYIIFFTCT